METHRKDVGCDKEMDEILKWCSAHSDGRGEKKKNISKWTQTVWVYRRQRFWPIRKGVQHKRALVVNAGGCENEITDCLRPEESIRHEVFHDARQVLQEDR